jgi:hypothetical protein
MDWSLARRLIILPCSFGFGPVDGEHGRNLEEGILAQHGFRRGIELLIVGNGLLSWLYAGFPGYMVGADRTGLARRTVLVVRR